MDFKIKDVDSKIKDIDTKVKLIPYRTYRTTFYVTGALLAGTSLLSAIGWGFFSLETNRRK